jgi:hypothetical protein
MTIASAARIESLRSVVFMAMNMRQTARAVNRPFFSPRLIFSNQAEVMQKLTLLLAHSTPAVIPAYRQALASVGWDATVVPILSPYPGLSSAYDALAKACRGKDGRILPALLARFGVKVTPGEPLWLACWSAGYALARALPPADVEALAGLVLLDSGHTGLDPDGTASDTGVAWAVEWARRAKTGRATFWLGCSDVKPPTYASTAHFAAEVERLAGGQGGRFRVEAFDVSRDAAAEHVAALRQWGDEFVARAVDSADLPEELTPAAAIEPEPNGVVWWRDLVAMFHGVDAASPAPGSLGDRAVDVALAELARNAREQPLGSNDGPDIAKYLAGCVRDLDHDGDEDPLRLAKGEWCAASACWSVSQALQPGEVMPHPWRAAGIEMEQDAAKAGTWRSAGDIRAGRYTIKRGDIAILNRGKPGSWTRHVVRVETAPDAAGKYRSVGGNEGDRWALTWRRIGDAEFRGVVACP